MSDKKYVENYKEDWDFRQGLENFKRGKYDIALSFFRTSIEKEGTEKNKSMFFIGKVYVKQKKEKEAKEQFNKYIEIDGDRSPHARLELGKLYAHQGKEKEAEEQFNKCIEIDKDRNPHARLELGKLYAHQGKEKEAEEQFNKCIETDKDRSPHARLELGKLYAQQGKEKEAEEQFNKCIEIDKEIKNPARRKLDKMYYERQRKKKAVLKSNEIFEKKLSNDESSILNSIRAKIYFNTISNKDIQLLDERKTEIPQEKLYLIKIAVYEKLNQKNNALSLIKEIEEKGIKIKYLGEIKSRLKSKKSKFSLVKWDEIIGWDINITEDYENEKKVSKEEKQNVQKDTSNSNTNISKVEKKKTKQIIAQKNTIQQEPNTFIMNSGETFKKEKKKIKKPKVENKKDEKIKDSLSSKVKEKITEIRKKYYVKMQILETQEEYIRKDDRLQSVLNSSYGKKRMQVELMLILINEGYRQTVKEEFPKEDYDFIDEIIKEFYQKKVTAKQAKNSFDEYCK